MADKNIRKKKAKRWIYPRHRVVMDLLRLFLTSYTRWKYNVDAVKFEAQGDRPYLILLNHQTPFDQFFVAMSIKGPIYFVATEDIFSKGWISSALRWLVAPIPIKKQTSDITAVMNCIRVAKEGGTIAIAPEGNRTYSGKTGYINPAIASLAKRLKLPVILYRIEGGYGVQPRWSDKTRRGEMRGYVYRVIEPEELEVLSAEELVDQIRQGLMVDEGTMEGNFRSKARAEYMERAIYVCPFCGFSKFESRGNETECLTCHRKIHYREDKKLEGVGFEFPYKTFGEWYEAQEEYIHQLDPDLYLNQPVFRDEVNFYEVIVNRRKRLLHRSMEAALYGDRVVMGEGTDEEMILDFPSVTAAAVLGRSKVNLYHQGRVFQMKGDQHFNALKYVNFYYHYRNITGDLHGKFLGL